jgi:hypothetical protein
MIPQRNLERNTLKSMNQAMNENPPKIPPKIAEKEKRWEQRIWHEIEKEDFTMNILAKSGYKPLRRITNLGWQKTHTKIHSHHSPSLPKSTPK